MGDDHSAAISLNKEGGVMKDSLQLLIKSNFELLSARGLRPNEAAAMSLKMAMGKLELLTSDQLLAAISDARSDKGSKTMARVAHVVRTTVASRDAVSIAFLAKPDERERGNLLGLDPAAVKAFYEGLVALGSEATRPLMDAADTLTKDLEAAVEEHNKRVQTPAAAAAAAAACAQPPIQLAPPSTAATSATPTTTAAEDGSSAAAAAAAEGSADASASTAAAAAAATAASASAASAAVSRSHCPELCQSVMRSLVFLLDNPLLLEPEHHPLYHRFCSLMLSLPPLEKQQLIKTIASYPPSHIHHLIDIAQQAITIQLYEEGRPNRAVRQATRALGMLFSANEKSSSPLPSSSFHNDAINSGEFFSLPHDYVRWQEERHADRHTHSSARSRSSRSSSAAADASSPPFTFCAHPYVLDVVSKSSVLQLDSQLEQRQRFDQAIMQGFMTGVIMPYCVIRVRREHVVEDAITQMQIREGEWKKQLKVQFVGEEGIDEGGVQKEFFQLIVKKIFDAQFGMFTYTESSRTFWFSPSPIDMPLEFELMGSVLGLAIYNSHILDMRFPLVVYKKLLGKKVVLSDLAGVDSELHSGLKQLLEFQGNVEEVYSWNFEASYRDVFDTLHTVPLKEGGEKLPVTNENRREFVNLLVDFHLNKVIDRQFAAFSRGFLKLCGGAVLRMFQAEELELAICGSDVFDFEELEKGARYEDGYTKQSTTIKNFWKIVHSLPDEEKRNLLSFVTGSDRAPVKGLASLPFIISRNGSDSDRLPTAHTCFNHLLLPEYATYDKLRGRLLTAINNSQGFGLL